MKKTPARTLQETQLLTWLPVIVLMLIAALIRWQLTGQANYYLLSGGDGPYAPLQVRSLLENGTLAFPDMPLLFLFQSEVARLLQLIGGLSQSDAIFASIRLIDVVVPPLAAIPMFLIVRELRTEGVKAVFVNYLLVAFALLNFTPVISFAGQLQKNGVAVVEVFVYLYLLVLIVKYGRRRDVCLAFFTLLICALTHFGSFGILLFFTVVFWMFGGLKMQSFTTGKKSKALLYGSGGLVLLLGLLAFFDPVRFDRLLHIPLRLFEAPVLLLMLDGQDLAQFVNPVTLIGANILWLFALGILLRNRKQLEPWKKTIAWTFLIIALCMTSPLIGIEWANRMYLMSYVPLTIIYAVLFGAIRSVWARMVPVTLLALLVALPVMTSFVERSLSITPESYAEFAKMNAVNFQHNDALVGRQDLRLLGNWCFRTKGIADYKVTAADFDRFGEIYVVQQKKGSNLNGPRYQQMELPGNAEKVYNSDYFELYRIPDASGWEAGNAKPTRITGKIVAVRGDRVTILSERSGTNRIARMSAETQFEHMDRNSLRTGMTVRVWGSGVPFSLDVRAEKIVVLDTSEL